VTKATAFNFTTRKIFRSKKTSIRIHQQFSGNSCSAKDKTCKDCGRRRHFAKSKFCNGTTKHHTVAKVEEMSEETLFAVKGKSAQLV